MPKIALVEYFTSSIKTYIFIVRPEDAVPIVREARVTEEQIKACVPNLGDTLSGESGEIIKPDFQAIDRLAGELIEPFLMDVEEFDILYLVPHGWLHYIPLHAARCKDGEYLIQKHQVVYSPSATVIKYCRLKNPRRKPDNNNSNGGNPSYLSLGVGAKLQGNRQHNKLFEREARLIYHKPGPEGICKTGEQATKELFSQECENKDIIHVACHGYFDHEDPLKSGLLLAAGGSLPCPTKKVGQKIIFPPEMLLTAEELFNHRFTANLVTLSACVTGLNENKPGDELIGLTRACIYAGTPSVLVNLWHVRLESNLRLIESFYTHWLAPGKKISKVEALQKAQLEMINDTSRAEWQHPYHWAPFVLVGDWL